MISMKFSTIFYDLIMVVPLKYIHQTGLHEFEAENSAVFSQHATVMFCQRYVMVVMNRYV